MDLAGDSYDDEPAPEDRRVADADTIAMHNDMLDTILADDKLTDELIERLEAVARKHEPFRVRLAGAGAFPSVERAKVLWAGVDQPEGRPLNALAAGARKRELAVARLSGLTRGQTIRTSALEALAA